MTDLVIGVVLLSLSGTIVLCLIGIGICTGIYNAYKSWNPRVRCVFCNSDVRRTKIHKTNGSISICKSCATNEPWVARHYDRYITFDQNLKQIGTAYQWEVDGEENPPPINYNRSYAEGCFDVAKKL